MSFEGTSENTPCHDVGLGSRAGAWRDLVKSPQRLVFKIDGERAKIPFDCPMVRSPMIGAVTTGLANSQARATSAGPPRG
jgi:hypothetical protein